MSGLCLSCEEDGDAAVFRRGEEAGRLAAIRAEVERHAEQRERAANDTANEAQALEVDDWPSAEALYYVVGALRREAADCRRWLQETT